MAGMKISVDAAMRARDVSRPSAAQEAEAELSSPPGRPRADRPSDRISSAGAEQGRSPSPRPEGDREADQRTQPGSGQRRRGPGWRRPAGRPTAAPDPAPRASPLGQAKASDHKTSDHSQDRSEPGRPRRLGRPRRRSRLGLLAQRPDTDAGAKPAAEPRVQLPADPQLTDPGS